MVPHRPSIEDARTTARLPFRFPANEHPTLALARIHRGRALGTALEAARECSSESGIMVFETENQPETRSTQ